MIIESLLGVSLSIAATTASIPCSELSFTSSPRMERGNYVGQLMRTCEISPALIPEVENFLHLQNQMGATISEFGKVMSGPEAWSKEFYSGQSYVLDTRFGSGDDVGTMRGVFAFGIAQDQLQFIQVYRSTDIQGRGNAKHLRFSGDEMRAQFNKPRYLWTGEMAEGGISVTQISDIQVKKPSSILPDGFFMKQVTPEFMKNTAVAMDKRLSHFINRLK